MKKTDEKGGFSSKLGFVLAAAGSAVGLGNLWRFPYLAAQYGGGIFLLIYLILAVTFGFTLMVTEIAIGRKTGKSALYAYSALDKRFGFIGILTSAVPIIITPYYCVIGGWVLKYAVTYISGGANDAVADNFFGDFISGVKQPIIWLLIFIFVTALVVMAGVTEGVERVSKFLMPVLVILTIGIAIYILILPESREGLGYYLLPDFNKLSVNTVLAALGQLFYSMSLAMGIMITYGSYLDKKEHIEKCVRNVEIFDTVIAFFAGLIIMPSVFAFGGGEEAAKTQGPSLMFVTLPKVFDSMPFGSILGAVFFILVLFAALTSAISLMETVVSIFQNRFKKSRRMVCLAVMLATMVLAIPSSLGFGVWSEFTIWGLQLLDFFDFISNSVLMPVVALLTCIFIGFVVKPDVVINEVERTGEFKSKKMYRVLIQYVAPIFILLILISSILNTFGVIHL